jgi:hypothetical protein
MREQRYTTMINPALTKSFYLEPEAWKMESLFCAASSKALQARLRPMAVLIETDREASRRRNKRGSSTHTRHDDLEIKNVHRALCV